MAQKLIITYDVLYSMLGDPTFYAAVPVCYFMKPQALATVDQIVKTAICPGPNPPSVEQQMRPLMEQFTWLVVELARENRGALDALKDYVARKRGFRPDHLVVYHRSNGVVQALEL